jgi:hypothetical protein
MEMAMAFKIIDTPFTSFFGSGHSLRTCLQGLSALVIACLVSCSRAGLPGPSISKEHAMSPLAKHSRIVFLHHSTGEVVWKGGLPQFIQSWNKAHGTNYGIGEMNYPSTAGAYPQLRKLLPARVFNQLIRDHYPWDNQPYDYWNLWVAHTGEHRDRFELNLDDLVRSYDVIVFKHCYPVSSVKPDDGSPSVVSSKKTLANYQLQYKALKERLHQFPQTRFIVWTGPALTQAITQPEDAERARQFATWVKETWDEKGDNIYVWDFRDLETEGGLFLKPEYAIDPKEPYPTKELAARIAPLLGQRIVDVIEGRGDSSSLTGQ